MISINSIDGAAKMISFQIVQSEMAVQIEVDDDGVQALVDALNTLRGSGSHVHLRSPSAGGSDLADKTPWGDPAVGEVIISHGGD